MNERIRELYNLACRIDMKQHPGAIPDGERILQKFAELIVRESAELLYDLSFNAGEKIKEHFGVEE